jgi:Ca2+-transporting ATPase
VTGLSQQEAAQRLIQFGYNELPASKRRSIVRIALDMLREPMLLLLAGCAVIYFLLGDIREASVLAGFVFVVIGIDFYQQQKTERALEALRDLSSPRALVIRDGEQRRIAGRDVVPGDVLILGQGDRVPADAILTVATNLMVDESLLTGESVPVRKAAGTGEERLTVPGGDDLPFVYSGTLIVDGSGIATVVSTGLRTELGKIGTTLRKIQPEPTLLQTDTRRMVRTVAIAGISMCGVFLLIYGLTRGDWLRGFLAALTLAMAVLPEELPVVVTVFLALGAWRISKVNVLTRTPPAIEMLGATTVLCVDKTGTLTQNQMEVRKLYSRGEFLDVSPGGQSVLPEHWHDLVEYALLASSSEALDPMDRAIQRLAGIALSGTGHIHKNWNVVRQYPLARDRLAISHVWISPDQSELVIASKGAPEAVLDLCHLPPVETGRLTSAASELAGEGLRVLGVAKARFAPADLPANQHDFDFEFLGFVALADPLRPSVPASVREAQQAGIRVVMITGDYPETARSIAAQAGLGDAVEVVTGPEIEAMDETSLREKASAVNVFARAVPEQKLRLVNALKANGEIVAMTGDGVNDAPALEAAHIGIAMGAHGTDVAREAADLVLLDDDFSSIVKAVRTGRRIFDNLKKASGYIIAIHVPIAGLSFVPVLAGWPLILGAMHIAFLELIIDPACSIVFEAEPEGDDIMRRPPRPAKSRLFNRSLLAQSVLQGVGMLGILLAIFAVALRRGQGEADARALTFTSLVVMNLALIQANRSSRGVLADLRRPNAAMWWVVGAALLFLVLVLETPYLRDLFRFSVLHPNDVALCATAAIVAGAWFGLLKWIFQGTEGEGKTISQQNTKGAPGMGAP